MKNTTVLPGIIVDIPSYQLLDRYCRNYETTVAKLIRNGLVNLLSASLTSPTINPDGLNLGTLFPNPQRGRPSKTTPDEE